MKIGIISIHSAHNYGSVLQAYALQEEIKKFNEDVKIINYRPNYFDTQYKMFSIKVYKRYKGIINKILHLGWRILKIRSRYIKYRKFENYIKNRYNLTKKYRTYKELEKANFDFDIIFCGSDQIWNTDITEGFDKSFYLGFADKKTIKASYAASVGREKIDLKYEEEYKKYIGRLDFIALREEESKNIIQEYTEKPITITIDPTLLIEKEKWNEIASKSKMDIKDKYILVYILEENEEFVKIVNAISEFLGIRVISPSKKIRFNNETIYPEVGPEDFVKLFKNAEFVITNSFHGTVFSLIYEKKNCIIPHKKTGARMCNLMKKAGLEDRIIANYNDLNLKKINKDIEYDRVKENLDAERKIAEDYIRNVLSANGN